MKPTHPNLPPEEPTRDTAAPEHLDPFGLAGSDDDWINVFAEASREAPPGNLGEYEVLAEVARGGQGVVYRARRGVDGPVVALKLAAGRAFASPSARRRLLREAEAARGLDHPCIVKLLGLSMVSGSIVLEFEWVDGVDAAHWSDRGEESGRRGIDEIVNLLLEVCDAVRHAHQRGVIHRDLKAGNILVDRFGRPRVLDFGLAKIAGPGGNSPTLTEPGDFVGTLAYAAPEQVTRTSEPDVRCDVYALGVLAFRMLTGALPYDTSGPPAKAIESITGSEPPAPSSLRPAIPRDLDAIVLRALEKDPQRRYQSADGLAEDLRRFKNNEAVLAHRPSSFYTLTKLARRHKAITAGITMSAAALASTAGIATWAALRIAKENTRVEQSMVREAGARRVAEKVADFLRGTLELARPGDSGADTRLLDVLRHAARRAETDLGDDQATASAVLYSVGQTMRTLWLYNEGAPVLQAALDKAIAVHGPTSEEAARCMASLSACLANIGDPRAVALAEDSLRIRIGLHGSEHPLTADSRTRLGFALVRTATEPDFDRASQELDEALRTLRSLATPSVEAVGNTLHTIAFLQWRKGKLDAAEEAYTQAAKYYREAGPGGSAGLAECLTGYLGLLTYTGRWSDAVAVADEALPILRDRFGEAWTIRAELRRALALRHLRSFDAAAEGYARALAATCRDLAPGAGDELGPIVQIEQEAIQPGGPNPEVVLGQMSILRAPRQRELEPCIDGLAWVELERGNVQRAQRIFEQLRDVRSMQDHQAFAGIEGLAACALERGDYNLAAGFLESLISERKRTGEADAAPAQLAWLVANLGRARFGQGQMDEAVALLSGASDTLARQHGAGHSRTIAAQNWLQHAAGRRPAGRGNT